MATKMDDKTPTKRGKASSSFTIHEAHATDRIAETMTKGRIPSINGSKSSAIEDPIPLTTNKRGNQSSQACNTASSLVKKQKAKPEMGNENLVATEQAMGGLLAKLNEQQGLLKKQQRALSSEHAETPGAASGDRESSSEGSVPITPATETLSLASANDKRESDSDHPQLDPKELLRLKSELEAAKSKIALMDQELSQTRITRHTLDQALGPASEADFPTKDDINEHTISNLQNALNGSSRGPLRQRPSWASTEGSPSEASEPVSVKNYPRPHGIWRGQDTSAPIFASGSLVDHQANTIGPSWGQDPSRAWLNRGMSQCPPYQQHDALSPYSGPLMSSNGSDGGYMNDYLPGPQPHYPNRGPPYNGRMGMPYNPRNGGWNSHQASMTPSGGMPHLNTSFQELTVMQSPSSPTQTYISPTEPLNYRRLLDRSVNCNWKYIVDKIVCNNDQQASIFLQQKLKLGTTEQKSDVVEAIVAQAYPLMVNRFGNFLVQRCFEHGTPNQVVAIANAIRGNTLSLSMDAFGCHVVQKAFDSVPEEYKAIMVHELLRRIPETVIHRYACHVWQKLFELRWNDAPPQIMRYVNEALRGMWHEVALGETGSLVVQNVFENCLEEDKRPCINEVLAYMDLVAHGQFGNWCIQHICEHGAPMDRSRAIDHVLRYATEYSIDQFASKVVEKCLKVGGSEFLGRYLERVCEGRPDRPRIPLIDIASDQYGNYLVQYILTHSIPQHREIVANHIRKHMVSLRGSKFGSRVGMLCGNHAFATRPGPGVGPPMSRFGNARFGGPYR
ncbi:MAG: hypothetical protein M1817_003656 [Caeruleum heppii]|nr:MAG: hypothetical protein M1817_003656 [Caeruleum heppii]